MPDQVHHPLDGGELPSADPGKTVDDEPLFSLSSLVPFRSTRCGDITGLDVIGIPVWFATRPNSRALSVSQGKGLTHEQARIGAIMESIEGAVAEQTRELVAEFATAQEMAARGRKLVPLERLSRCKYTLFDPARQRAWVRGIHQRSGAEVHAPYELIGLDTRVGFPWDYRVFTVASTGLAAGRTFEFAATRALFEAIERDATLPVELFGLSSAFARRLLWQPGLHAGLDTAVGKVSAAGLMPHFYQVTSKTGLPVVGAVISRPVLDAQGAGERLSGGYACRLEAGEAMLAALLEAVQSRLTNIAGARDDMDPSQYRGGNSIVPLPRDEAMTLSFLAERHPARDGLSDNERLGLTLEALAHAGCEDVFLFDLPSPSPLAHVVRILAPGLNAYMEGDVASVGVNDLIPKRVEAGGAASFGKKACS